ncbi:MAG: hypothetical protein JSS09_01880, partial [Verrucomicrobia bacterium]|nr:hypothetical protein [Verrucomicrobiota bacterium]
MFKQVSLLCTSVFLAHSSLLLGDHPGDLSDMNSESIFVQPFSEQISHFSEEPSTKL